MEHFAVRCPCNECQGRAEHALVFSWPGATSTPAVHLDPVWAQKEYINIHYAGGFANHVHALHQR